MVITILAFSTSAGAVAKPSKSWETLDLNGDGLPDYIYKVGSKKNCVVVEYYTPDWDYVGEEEFINGEIVMDTFESYTFSL